MSKDKTNSDEKVQVTDKDAGTADDKTPTSEAAPTPKGKGKAKDETVVFLSDSAVIAGMGRTVRFFYPINPDTNVPDRSKKKYAEVSDPDTIAYLDASPFAERKG